VAWQKELSQHLLGYTEEKLKNSSKVGFLTEILNWNFQSASLERLR
jgi:hypothetical protein